MGRRVNWGVRINDGGGAGERGGGGRGGREGGNFPSAPHDLPQDACDDGRLCYQQIMIGSFDSLHGLRGVSSRTSRTQAPGCSCVLSAALEQSLGEARQTQRGAVR